MKCLDRDISAYLFLGIVVVVTLMLNVGSAQHLKILIGLLKIVDGSRHVQTVDSMQESWKKL